MKGQAFDLTDTVIHLLANPRLFEGVKGSARWVTIEDTLKDQVTLTPSTWKEMKLSPRKWAGKIVDHFNKKTKQEEEDEVDEEKAVVDIVIKKKASVPVEEPDPMLEIHTFPAKFKASVPAGVLNKVIPMDGRTPLIFLVLPEVDKEIVKQFEIVNRLILGREMMLEQKPDSEKHTALNQEFFQLIKPPKASKGKKRGKKDDSQDEEEPFVSSAPGVAFVAPMFDGFSLDVLQVVRAIYHFASVEACCAGNVPLEDPFDKITKLRTGEINLNDVRAIMAHVCRSSFHF